MNEILVKYGWECYKKGCSCQGLPKYYKHDKHENYICITKSGYGIIKRDDGYCIVTIKGKAKSGTNGK